MGIQRDGRGQPDPYIVGANERCRYHGAWYNETPGDFIDLTVQILQGGIPYSSVVCDSGTVGSTIDDNGTFYGDLDLPADTSFAHRVRIRRNGVVEVTNMQSFKSVAMAVEFQSLSVSNPQQTSIDFSGQWKPNTNESTATAYLYYKKTTDPGWTLFSNSGAQTGTGWKTYNATVTGLTAGTSYQFYLYVSRTVSNSSWAGQGTTIVYGGTTYGFLPHTNASSSVVSLSTLASTPVVTTEGATSVSYTAATLNGTIDANSLPGGVDCSFQWNTQAYRKVAYNDAVNVTAGKILTLGSQVYYFKDNAAATGSFDYTGQPNAGETVDIEDTTYTFKAEVTADDGVIEYDPQPNTGETVTIPTISGPAGVYTFKVEQAATGGKLAYGDATVPTAAKIVTIPAGGVNPDGVYTFVAVVAVAGDVKIEASADATMLNLSRCINKSGGTEGAGQDYMAFDFGSGAAAHPLVVATHDSVNDEVTFAIASVGPVGNIDITTTETSITPTDPTGGSWVEDPGDVLIGAAADDTFLNLTRCINKSGGTEGEGEDYMAFDFGAGAAAHPDFVATHDSVNNLVTLAAQGVGSDYNVDITSDVTGLVGITDPANGAWVDTAGDVLIGATEDDTFLNLTRAINNSGGTSGEGEDYMPFAGSENPWVTAVHDSGGNSVDLTAVDKGAAGNDITLADDSAAITANAMSGGADIPGTNDYEVLIGADADATMLNFQRAINKSGGTEGIDYNAVAAHPYCVAQRRALDDYVDLVIETNVNPTLTFTTDEATFTLTTDLEDPWSNETTPVNYANDGTTPFSATLSGLSKERTYFFKAKAVYTANGGGTLYGSEYSFSTPGEPGPLAVEEEHMQTIQFDGQYGQSKTVTCSLREPSSSSSDLFYTGTAPVAADLLLYKDGVYSAIATNGMTRVNNYLYTLVLTASEMQCEVLDIIVHDAAGSAFRDAHLQVRTAMRLSEIDVDATQGPADASAIVAIGNDDGHGIFATSTGAGSDINAILSSMWLRVGNAQAGAAGSEIKLDTNASTTNDYYNDSIVCLISGTGAGQARVITGYNGGTRIATVDSSWSTNPDATTVYAIGAGARPWQLAPSAELSSMPSPTASFGEMMQLLFQRFAFKIDQTASAQTWYDSSGNPLFDRAVSDDGVTQTIEALAEV